MSFPVIDAHQHIWDPSRAEYDWLGPDFQALNRKFTLEELLPTLNKLGIDLTIQVQSADNLQDTELMQESAELNPEVAGIVGFAPLDNPKKVQETIERWKEHELIVGVRNLIHNKPDPNWLMREDVNESLALLAAADLTFDIVSVLPEHLALLPKLSERHPNLRMVIDHLSKPPIGASDSATWRQGISQAAKNPNVFAKISGLYSSVGDPSSWSTETIQPHFDFAVETFGASRLMYGGDWPISLIAGGYERVWNGLKTLIDCLSTTEKEWVLGRTAFEFYRLPDSRIAPIRS